MRGRIIKAVAGFYYVRTQESGVYACKARGLFRKEHQKPLVGDEVLLDSLSVHPPEGQITRILPRKNALVRPAAANIDFSLICMAFSAPKPRPDLLDLFLVHMEEKGIPAGICINKADLALPGEKEALRRIYKKTPYPLFFISAKTGEGLWRLQEALAGRITALAGPSGVGKSSLANRISGTAHMPTGTLSPKTRRGRHTTRHLELLECGEGAYLLDTPGFSSLDISGITPEHLSRDFPEFSSLAAQCRFAACAHLREPGCAVRDAVAAGRIARERYASYTALAAAAKEAEKRNPSFR